MFYSDLLKKILIKYCISWNTCCKRLKGSLPRLRFLRPRKDMRILGQSLKKRGLVEMVPEKSTPFTSASKPSQDSTFCFIIWGSSFNPLLGRLRSWGRWWGAYIMWNDKVACLYHISHKVFLEKEINFKILWMSPNVCAFVQYFSIPLEHHLTMIDLRH